MRANAPSAVTGVDTGTNTTSGTTATGKRRAAHGQRLEQEHRTVAHHVGDDVAGSAATPQQASSSATTPASTSSAPKLTMQNASGEDGFTINALAVATAGVKMQVTIWSTSTSAGFRGNNVEHPDGTPVLSICLEMSHASGSATSLKQMKQKRVLLLSRSS